MTDEKVLDEKELENVTGGQFDINSKIDDLRPDWGQANKDKSTKFPK